MLYLLAPILLLTATAVAARPAGMIDGDSLELAGPHVRLVGIDAPEGKQLCQRDGREWPAARGHPLATSVTKGWFSAPDLPLC